MISDELLDFKSLVNRMPEVEGRPIVSARTMEKIIKEDRESGACLLQPEYRKGRVRYWSNDAIDKFKSAILIEPEAIV